MKIIVITRIQLEGLAHDFDSDYPGTLAEFKKQTDDVVSRDLETCAGIASLIIILGDRANAFLSKIGKDATLEEAMDLLQLEFGRILDQAGENRAKAELVVRALLKLIKLELKKKLP